MKTTEQLARECGLKYGSSFCREQLEAFRAAVIRDWFESAEPVAYRKQLEFESGDKEWKYVDFPILANAEPLFAAPKEE